MGVVGLHIIGQSVIEHNHKAVQTCRQVAVW